MFEHIYFSSKIISDFFYEKKIPIYDFKYLLNSI